MKSIEVKRTIMLLNTETKERVNIYTFVDLENHETQTVVGAKFEMPLHKPLKMVMTIKIQSETFELKDLSRKYLNTANLFIVDLKEVKN